MDAIKAKLTTTFVEQEDGSEERAINGQTVLIYRPPGRVVGLTFLITAVSMPVSKYRSTIQALTETDRKLVVVQSTASGILELPLTTDHQTPWSACTQT